MSPRNVIITLVLVIALIVFIIFKIRLEPKKKFSFNRNPSRAEYVPLALCRMDCQGITANDIMQVVRKGDIDYDNSDLRKRPCATFTINGKTKKGMGITIIVAQCGNVARITDCYLDDRSMPCNCPGDDRPVSLKLKIDALPV